MTVDAHRLATEANWNAWKQDDFRPYLDIKDRPRIARIRHGLYFHHACDS
jgi:hypothetical protein